MEGLLSNGQNENVSNDKKWLARSLLNPEVYIAYDDEDTKVN